MNQQQVKYLKERIEVIYNAKCADIKAKFASTATSLTKEEQLAQIKSGKAKLKSPLDNYTYLREAFTYEGESKTKELQTKAAKKIAEEIANLAVIKRQLVDELLLGDSSEALNKLKQFESVKI